MKLMSSLLMTKTLNISKGYTSTSKSYQLNHSGSSLVPHIHHRRMKPSKRKCLKSSLKPTRSNLPQNRPWTSWSPSSNMSWNVNKAKRLISSRRSSQFASLHKLSFLWTPKNLQKQCTECWERPISNPTSCSLRCPRRRETTLWSVSESSRSMCLSLLIWLPEVLMCLRPN